MLKLNDLDVGAFWEATLWIVHGSFWEVTAGLTVRSYILRYCSEKLKLCRVETYDSEFTDCSDCEEIGEDVDMLM